MTKMLFPLYAPSSAFYKLLTRFSVSVRKYLKSEVLRNGSDEDFPCDMPAAITDPEWIMGPSLIAKEPVDKDI